MLKRRTKKAKAVAFRYIPPGSEVGDHMYALLAELVEHYHPELQEARIALAFNLAWKADVDGVIKLGECRKVADLEREVKEVTAFDFIIVLSRRFWTSSQVTDHQRRALLDHELHHAAPKYDDKGEPMLDECGRRVWRIRRHDVEEFAGVIERYGCYKADLEQFAAALKRAPRVEFQPCDRCQDSPGWIRVKDGSGTSRVTRCECYLRWAQTSADWRTEEAMA